MVDKNNVHVRSPEIMNKVFSTRADIHNTR